MAGNILGMAWQPKVGGRPGERVEGLAELEQSLMTVLGTQLGSVPGRLTFGINFVAYIDKPLNRVRGPMSREVQRAVKASEPRITVLDVTPVPAESAGGRMRSRVKWRPTNPIDPTRPNIVRETVG